MASGLSIGPGLVSPVALSKPLQTLRNIILASREDNAAPATTDIDPRVETASCISVRPVSGDSQQKWEFLATDNNGVSFRCFLQRLPQQQQKYNAEVLVEFDHGTRLIELPQDVANVALGAN